MRPSCTNCARKHLAQAIVLLQEAHQGYPEHYWLAMGHLAEASDELVRDYPEAANLVRDQRKALELDAEAKVDLLKMIEMVGNLRETAQSLVRGLLGAVQASNLTASPQPLLPTPTCPPCEEARRRMTALRSQQALDAENVGPGKRYRGRLVILTTLGDWGPAYSLTTVIVEQARAAVRVGLRVDIWVHEQCDMRLCPVFPEAVQIHQVIPRIHWRPDLVVDEDCARFTAAIAPLLAALVENGKADIIVHDVLFQAAYLTAAKALHDLGNAYGPSITWWYLAHSAPSARPIDFTPSDPRRYRYTIPLDLAGGSAHRVLCVNYSHVPALRDYYGGYADVRTLANGRDARTLLDLDADALTLVDAGQLLTVDVVQVLPVSATRFMEKGVFALVRLLAVMAKDYDLTVRLVLALAHANGTDELQRVQLIKRAAEEAGLPAGSILYSHELLPSTSQTGLAQKTLRGLFALSNLFAFPTISEAASLVVWEAAQAGCLMVLNGNLPCLREQVPAELALWVSWPTVSGMDVLWSVDEVAAQVVTQLQQPGYRGKRAALQRASLERYAGDLGLLLGYEAAGG